MRGHHRYLRGSPEDLWRDLLRRHVPGKTVVDVGCMWHVHGAYAFHALASGATRVTGIDVGPATPEFLRRNTADGSPKIRFIQGDVNDPALVDVAGRFDVVFCSGVLYHVPDPILTLRRLHALCQERLILTTASITERRDSQSAIFLPGLSDAARTRLRYDAPRRRRKVGLDTTHQPEKGYGNWFWLPTPSCVRAMATIAGFVVEAVPHRRVTTVVARPA
jgi:hypothetical protein